MQDKPNPLKEWQTEQSGDLSLTPALYRKQRFLYRFTSAYRTLARFCQPVSFSEDKAALFACRRDNGEIMAGLADRLLDVLEMPVYLPLGNTDFC